MERQAILTRGKYHNFIQVQGKRVGERGFHATAQRRKVNILENTLRRCAVA